MWKTAVGVSLLVTSSLWATSAETNFLVWEGPDYSIRYDPRVQRDISLAREWIDHTFQVGREFYGVGPDRRCPLQVVLYPRLFMEHVDKGFQPGVFVRSEPGFS